MAVTGFSSQTTTPFRPSSFAPPYFWICHSCPGSFSTSRSFWATSRNAFRRHEVCRTLATCVYLSNGPVFGDSFEKISSHRTTQSNESYLCDNGASVCFSCQQLNLGIHSVTRNPTSSLHMSPPCRFAAARKIFSRRHQHQLIKQSRSHVDLPSVNSSYPAERTWKEEAEAFKKEKQDYKNHFTKQDGSAYISSQVGTNNDLAHQLTSNSPCSVRKIPDSTSHSRFEPTFGNGHFSTTITPEPKISNCSDSKGRGSQELSSPEKRHMMYFAGLRGQGCMSVQRLKSSRTIDDSNILLKQLPAHYSRPNGSSLERALERQEKKGSIVGEINGNNVTVRDPTTEEYFGTDGQTRTDTSEITNAAKETSLLHLRERLGAIYEKVLVIDNISAAEAAVHMLKNQYRQLVHACDTEVAKIDVKQETPVDHGEVICFSIYSGPEADFGNGKSCIWVDVLNGGGKNLITKFAPFFEDKHIKKVWHNYSFDSHALENYGIKLAGFHADTMHMARLWNSSRRTEGGYSLESLTGDSSVMSDARLCPGEELVGKLSMKTVFGQKKVKKDGSEGKVITIPSFEELQTVEWKLWICYSSLDSISTLRLYESLRKKLSCKEWKMDGIKKGTMFNFYKEYWRPFGELLVNMETEGMLVERAYLAEIEKVAKAEQQVAADRFRDWASKFCPDARYMNVGSDVQLRQLFFGGIQNRKNPDESLEVSRDFKVPNTNKVIEEGKKAPTKFRTITLHRLFDKPLETGMYTTSGWPSVSGDALKALARKVSEEFEFMDEAAESQSGDYTTGAWNMLEEDDLIEDPDNLTDKTAYSAVGGEQGIEACNAISALCEVCSIDSLISNFILPLQGSHVAGKNGRIHCSLNINTETGRLSARRPNLQNQPALEKDRYKIRQAFVAAPGNSLIVADYGQLELRILAHLSDCKSMLDAFKAGGDFHSRTAMNMYPHIREAVENKHVLLEWHPQPGEETSPVPLLKDAFASERRKAKMLNFSIAYGKTAVGLAHDWKVSVEEARKTVNLWYSDRKEVLSWQEDRKNEARKDRCVHTLLGRARLFPSQKSATLLQKGHIERAAINTPVQGSAADVAMCAMLEISRNGRLKELGWKLLLQVHDEVILEGPTNSAELAKAIVVECMSRPFNGTNILKVGLSVDAKCAQNWYAAK